MKKCVNNANIVGRLEVCVVPEGLGYTDALDLVTRATRGLSLSDDPSECDRLATALQKVLKHGLMPVVQTAPSPRIARAQALMQLFEMMSTNPRDKAAKAAAKWTAFRITYPEAFQTLLHDLEQLGGSSR